MSHGQPNGLAELDSAGRVPALQTQEVIDLESSEALGTVLVSNGSGGLIPQINEYSEDDGGAATGLTSFQNYLTHTTVNLPAGNYDISWHYVYSHSVTNSSVQVVVRLIAPSPTTQDLNEPGVVGYMSNELSDSSDNIEVSGFKRINLLAGVEAIQIAFRTSSGGNASIRRGAIRIVKAP